jgi:hypothetical protein
MMDKTKQRRDQLLYTSEDNGGWNMDQYLILQHVSAKSLHDIGKIERAVSEMGNMIDTLVSGKGDLKKDWNTHLTIENIPKKYATEQEIYYQHSIGELDALVRELTTSQDKLSHTVQQLKAKSTHHKLINPVLSRKLKENKHHAESRKRLRVENKVTDIVTKLGRAVIDGEFSPEITGNFQISAAEEDMFLSVLTCYTRNEHLAKCLQIINGHGLFDHSAWKVIEKWMAETQ